MSNVILDTDFAFILKQELQHQLTEGYPCNVSKDILIKDIVDIVGYSMSRWNEERKENNG